MNNIFEITDKSGRKIHLSKERWSHITMPSSPHAYMTNYLQETIDTLIKPDKITTSIYDNIKVNYYKHYKNRTQFLRVIVKYLNGEGFVITSYFTGKIEQ